MKKGKQLLNKHDFIDGSKVIIIWDMIQKKESEGVLVNENDSWFVCQNDVAGNAPEDTHGYSYGWDIGSYWSDDDNISSVKHIYLAEEEKQDKPKIQLEHIEFVDESFVDKINRLIDTVNELQGHIKFLDERIRTKNFMVDVDKTNSISKHIDIEDPYAEQRRWIGKLCRFWNFKDGAVDIGILKAVDNLKPSIPYINDIDCSYAFCEPVKPDDDIIYKGE